MEDLRAFLQMHGTDFVLLFPDMFGAQAGDVSRNHVWLVHQLGDHEHKWQRRPNLQDKNQIYRPSRV